MKKTHPVIAIVLALQLVACGGGGSSGSPAPVDAPNPDPPAPPPEPLDPEGVWRGQATWRGYALDGLCRITPENNFPNDFDCVFFDQVFADAPLVLALDGQYGTLELAPGAWAARGTAMISGGIRTFSLEGGDVDQAISLDLEVDGDAMHFSGVPALQPPIAGAGPGTYSRAYMHGPISFEMDPEGDIFGQGGPCTIAGASNDLGYGGRFVELDATNCGGPWGIYSGFGIVSRDTGVVDPSSSSDLLFAFAVELDGYWLGGYALR